MIYLRDFPNEQIFSRMKEDYPSLDANAVSGFLRLAVIGSEFLDSLDKMLAQFGITHGRWITLLLLRRRKVWQALPSELAQEQGVSRATISGLIQQLEKQELLKRQPDSEDGRKQIAILTDAGASLVADILPNYFKLIDELMAPLDEQEKVILKTLTDKLLI